MRSPRSSLLLVALPALLVSLPGCGDDETLTRAQYVEQADAICKDYDERQRKLGAPTSVGDIERLADETRPLVEEQLAKLRKLEAPEEIAADAEEAYDLLEKQLPKIDDLVDAAKQNDRARIQEVATEAAELDDQADALAKEIGLKVCGQGD